MRKKILATVTALALAVIGFAPGTVFAANPPQTDVTGVVTENGNAVPGATVDVTCGTEVKSDTTNAQGSYLVTFSTIDCPFGSTVKVKAKKGSKTGSSSGTVHGITTKLNIAVVNVSIPEYGAIAAAVTSIAGIGTIAFTRRRNTRALGL